MICPECQAENSNNARFCRECGIALAAACSNCGHSNQPRSKFCGHCGNRLETAGMAVPSAPPSNFEPQAALDRFLPPELAARLRSAHREQTG